MCNTFSEGARDRLCSLHAASQLLCMAHTAMSAALRGRTLARHYLIAAQCCLARYTAVCGRWLLRGLL